MAEAEPDVGGSCYRPESAMANFGKWMGLLVLPLAAAAQDREVVLTGTEGRAPPVVYVKTDVPVLLVFDAPLRKEVALAVPSADVRRAPFNPNALEITPAAAFGRQGPIPFRVPLADGEVTLTLQSAASKGDHVVQVVRRMAGLDGGAVARSPALEKALHLLGPAVLDGPDTLRPQTVQQKRRAAKKVTVRVLDEFTYLQVRKTVPDCEVATAHLTRGGEAVDVLLLETGRTRQKPVQVLVARTPPVGADDYDLYLLAADGTACEHVTGITLQPGGAP
jgi:hypothetical protein